MNKKAAGQVIKKSIFVICVGCLIFGVISVTVPIWHRVGMWIQRQSVPASKRDALNTSELAAYLEAAKECEIRGRATVNAATEFPYLKESDTLRIVHSWLRDGTGTISGESNDRLAGHAIRRVLLYKKPMARAMLASLDISKLSDGEQSRLAAWLCIVMEKSSDGLTELENPLASELCNFNSASVDKAKTLEHAIALLQKIVGE